LTDAPDIETMLVRIYGAALARLEREIDSYTVPQLIDSVYKLTAVQLRIRGMRAAEDAQNVGSAVRKYSTAFNAADDAGRRGRTSRARKPAAPDAVDLAYDTLGDDDKY
jgi:hypothetical protein